MFQVNYLEESSDYLSYLPEFYSEIKEFQEIAKTVNIEIDLFKQRVLTLLKEQYIQTSEFTIKEKENEFKIVANSNETLEFRRERLIERKSRKPPITVFTLRDKINNFIKMSNTEVSLIPGEYAFVVKIPAVDGFKFQEVQGMINKLKPANMEYIQNPISLERVSIKEIAKEKKLNYARAGLAVAGRTKVGTVINTKTIYQL